MNSPKKNPLLSKEAYFFILLTILTTFVLFKFVDLTPHVDNDFFFSSDDPNFQADIEISRLFERKDSQIIISVTGDIFSDKYQEDIDHITRILSEYESVTSVISITNGPKNIKDAIKSPLWSRTLITEDQKSSNVMVILDETSTKNIIPKIEDLLAAMQAEDFKIRMSGFPYIVELIQRNLLIDLNVFSLLALLLFSIVVIMIFHSWRILIGMIVTCANAVALAFIINQLLGLKIGILTANLATIIFVLTLSHIVFLTFNWKHLHHPKSPHDQFSVVKEAMAITIPASFWAMFTTLLGFISLLFVQARPLRELGISGAIGTVTAFIVTYTIYPEFLRLKSLSHYWAEKNIKSFYQKVFRIFDKNHTTLIIGIMAIIIFTFPKLWTLDTDPSLLSFFAEDSEIHQDLKFIDTNGGSSPLVLVVKDVDNKLLNTRKIHKRLWQLQTALEKHPDIGTIISLPTLMAEGKKRPLSKFLSTKKLLSYMEKRDEGGFLDAFISKDHKYGLYLLRMKEQDRSAHRLEIIHQVETTVRNHQFNPHLMGGIYALQGHLSEHIASSLIYGLGRLIAAFVIIAFIVSLSIRITLAMTFSITLIPLCILGIIGYFNIPLDTISAPAANVAIAMGIDAMIHMAHAYRRIEKTRHHRLDDWVKVRRKMWEPIITSMFIICAGFGIFFFSSFPPTQRFGGAIVFGTIIAATTALFIFPILAKKFR